jgi:hypothetical protein
MHDLTCAWCMIMDVGFQMQVCRYLGNPGRREIGVEHFPSVLRRRLGSIQGILAELAAFRRNTVLYHASNILYGKWLKTRVVSVIRSGRGAFLKRLCCISLPDSKENPH